MVFIRTDKNGTKIYHDWTCPRCGGAGESSKWLYTGKVCYECGGTGKRRAPKIVKEYTEEYAAKLEAKRIAKRKKYEEEHADEIARKKEEQELREAEWKKSRNEWYFKDHGCSADGIGYVLTGNTYSIKDKIKKAGGRWTYNVWVCPEEIKADGVKATKIDLNTCMNDYGLIDGSKAGDMIFEIQKKNAVRRY